MVIFKVSPAPEKIDDVEAAVKAVVGCHRRIIRETLPELAFRDIQLNGTGLFYLGCTFWTGMASELSDILKLPVLDPGIGPVRVIESLAGFKVS